MPNSLPAIKRLILSLWRYKTNAEMKNNDQLNLGCGIWTIKEINGAIAAATKAAKDDFLNLNAITNQIANAQNVTHNDIPSITPNAVATPLPPLKLKNKGHI